MNILSTCWIKLFTIFSLVNSSIIPPMKTTLETLIIDDDKPTIHYIKTVVRETKIQGQVHTAIDGKNGFEILDSIYQDRERYLVLLDIDMPVMDGWGFLEALKDKPYSDKTQVIIVTSSTSDADKEKSKEYAHVIGFLEKPVSSQTLQEVLDLFDSNLVLSKS